MKTNRFLGKLGLVVLLGLAPLSEGCGPGTMAPDEREKADALIKKDRTGRHKAISDDLKTATQARGGGQKKQTGGRKSAQRDSG